jgi:uncharacterized protein YndB with AHSA1/START domain
VAAPFHFDRRFTFAVGPAVLWETLTRTDQYPQWWNWLREFDSEGLRAGQTARCVIRAPLPYVLRFDVHVDRVVEGELVSTHIDGDLDGPARLEVTPAPDGCAARLVWSLRLRDPVLRRVALVGRPAMSWAHDRIVDIGVRQFEERALDGARPHRG